MMKTIKGVGGEGVAVYVCMYVDNYTFLCRYTHGMIPNSQLVVDESLLEILFCRYSTFPKVCIAYSMSRTLLLQFLALFHAHFCTSSR